MISQLSLITELKFNNLSSTSSVRITFQALKKTMNKTLEDVLNFISKKYKNNQDRNESNIKIMKEHPRKYKQGNQFIQKKLTELYFEYLKFPDQIKGPSIYQGKYKQGQLDLLFIENKRQIKTSGKKFDITKTI